MLIIAEEAHKTDTGRQRHANEDSYYAKAPLFAVADGMGGAQAGEVASRIAASAFERRPRNDEASAEGQLEEIAQKANREIHQLAQKDSSRAGMGTTLTAAMLHDDEVAFGHVGDSRAYLLRDGQLKRLTKDHSLVEELRRQGRLTEEQAEEHPQRSIITRALGPEPSVNVDTMTFPARDGDVFLLCSDGLTTMVSDDEIREILVNSRNLRTAVSQAGRRREPPGRARQHHGGGLPGRRRRRQGRGGGSDPDFADRRAGRDDRRADAGGDRPVAGPGHDADAVPSPEGAQVGRRAGRDRGRGGRSGALRPLDLLPRHRRGGNVAVYRGLPYELPFGVSLYSKQYSIPVQEGALSEDRQRAVTGHTLRGKDDATSLADDIQRRPTEGVPQPPPPPAQKKQQQQKKSGAASTGKQAQKR